MNKIGKPNLEIFSETLLSEAKKNKDIIVVTSDSRGSGKLVPFGKELPDQIIEVGIAEQNLVGVSSGLAAGGKIVFGVSPASFLTARSLEQIKNDVAYSDRNVSIKQSISYGHPLYIRYGKKPMMDIHPSGTEFKIGKSIVVKKGEDLTIVATGETLQRAYLASEILKESNIHCSIISMHTIKPFDKKTFIEFSKNSKAILTVEEHSIFGGLGECCASLIAQFNINVKLKILGIPDEYMINGSQADVLDHYDMSPEKIAKISKDLLNK